LALGVYAKVSEWAPGDGFLLPSNFFEQAPQDRVERFFKIVGSDLKGMQALLGEAASEWDFLAFQQRPILAFDTGEYLVLDEGYLLDRVTRGLFWLVHDHEKQTNGEKARAQWTQAFGEMVELLAEASIRQMAPVVFGEVSFYTEEDFSRVYKGRVADAGIDFGTAFVLFEIVSGQLTTATRIDGDLQSFKKDTKRLVIDKVEQLDSVARAVLNNTRVLTGHSRISEAKVIPVVVVGGGYPNSPLTVRYAQEILEEKGYLKPPIRSLCVIDLGELEMLEALVEAGESLVDLLLGWKESAIAPLPLRNFILTGSQPRQPFALGGWMQPSVTR